MAIDVSCLFESWLQVHNKWKKGAWVINSPTPDNKALTEGLPLDFIHTPTQIWVSELAGENAHIYTHAEF